MLKEVEWVHHKHLQSRLDWLISVITSFTERLASKGARHDIEYEEELVHSVPAVACNAVASKVKDNIF